MLIGQDRAGKTSLKKCLIGLPFDPKENSTEGIEVDPSVFQVDGHEVKNWQPIDKSERGLLGCSEDVAKSVVEKLSIVSRYPRFREEEKGTEKHDSDQLANENYKSGTMVDDTDGEKRDDSFLNQVCLQLHPRICIALIKKRVIITQIGIFLKPYVIDDMNRASAHMKASESAHQNRIFLKPLSAVVFLIPSFAVDRLFGNSESEKRIYSLRKV